MNVQNRQKEEIILHASPRIEKGSFSAKSAKMTQYRYRIASSVTGVVLFHGRK